MTTLPTSRLATDAQNDQEQNPTDKHPEDDVSFLLSVVEVVLTLRQHLTRPCLMRLPTTRVGALRPTSTCVRLRRGKEKPRDLVPGALLELEGGACVVVVIDVEDARGVVELVHLLAGEGKRQKEGEDDPRERSSR